MNPSRKQIANYSAPVGFGYIVVPFDVDREKYVQTCYRKERVAVQLDGGGSTIDNCYISKESLQQIIFPESHEKLGSAVAFIVPHFHNIPIIVGVISKADETQLLEENSFKKIVRTPTANVSINGRGKSGELFVNVESDFENEGSIYITLRSKNNTSKFDVKCFGDISIYSEGKTSLKCLNDVEISSISLNETGEEIIDSNLTLNGDGFVLIDKFENKIESNKDGDINILPKEKCNVFQGSEPMVLGNILKEQLETVTKRINTILEALNAGKVAGGNIGSYILAVSAVLDTIPQPESFDEINSEKSFLD